MTTIAKISWRRIRIFMLLLAVLGAGAFSFATNVSAQGNIIEECLATEAKAEQDGTACIGRQADACLEKPEGLSTLGQVECIDR